MRLIALSVALLATATACKKKEEAAPAMPGTVAVKPARHHPGRRRIPEKIDPTRKMPGRKPLRSKVPLDRLRKTPRKGGLPRRLGTGTLTFRLGGKPQQLAVTVYHHRRRYLLSGERAGLGVVLALSSLEPGLYARGPATRWPDLRIRLGSGRLATALRSARAAPARALRVHLRRTGNAVTGSFSGEVRDAKGRATEVAGGSFQVRLSTAPEPRRRRFHRP